MDNQRVILFFALSFVLLLIWQSWQEQYAPTEPVAPIATERASSGQAPAVATDIPQAPVSADTPSSFAGAVPTVDDPMAAIAHGQRVHIVTDILDVEIDSIGGDIRQVDLRAFPIDADEPDKPLRLMQDSSRRVLIAQNGLLSEQGAPDHHAEFHADKTEYRLVDGVNSLQVPLRWRNADGVTVIKTYTFHRDSYIVDVEQRVENNSGQDWKGYQYRQLQRTRPGDDESSAFIYTYTGGVVYNEVDKYEKVDFDDMDDGDLNKDFSHGWAAMIQHYFLVAWIPEADEISHYYSKAPQNKPYVLGLVSPAKIVANGDTGVFNSRLYIGPKDQGRLEAAAPGLRLTVDYGVLTILAQPLFWLLSYIYGVLGNWGWSIIILTLIIKLIFYKLSEKSYKSMANMRLMQPKVVSIRERYGDDRQRMSQAMMELYKKEKINPLGGCLPMVVQIPVFIALYWVLLESVELRQADFMFWLKDLSTKDPFYILPLLMGITMFVQQKLNPPPPDPVQAKVLMSLPFIFTIFFAFFPSGLVLYWVTNSALSILQQWVITRNIEKASANKKLSQS